MQICKSRCGVSEDHRPARLYCHGNIAGLDGGLHSLHNEICKSALFTFLRKLCAFAREPPVPILNVAFAALIFDVIDSATPMWKSHYDVIKPPVRDHISSPILDLETTWCDDYHRVGCLQRWVGIKHSSHSDGITFRAQYLIWRLPGVTTIIESAASNDG